MLLTLMKTFVLTLFLINCRKKARKFFFFLLLLVLNVLLNPSCQKSNIYERDWSKFIQQNFVLDYFGKDWSDFLQLDQQDVNIFINLFLDNMNSILDEHAPLK